MSFHNLKGFNNAASYPFFLFLILLYVFISLMGCKDKEKSDSTDMKRQTVKGVVIKEVQPVQIDEYYETSGTVKAKTISVITSRVMGTVTSINVKEGSVVHAGQLLMTIDDRDLIQRVKAAEKAVETAKLNKSLMDITYQRYKNLYDEKAISQQEIDQIETQKKVAEMEYERAKAMLTEAQVQHGFTRITAPISGIVTEKRIEIGSMAMPGTPLLTVEDSSYFRIEANVDERLFGKLKIGMPVEVIIESIGKKTAGKISDIIPAVDPMSRTFLVKIDLKMSSLRTGLYGKVFIPVAKKAAMMVPKKSVVEKGQLVGVYIVDEKGVIKYRLIKVGKDYGDQVEVLSGLNFRDKIIVEGVEKAVDGGVVR